MPASDVYQDGVDAYYQGDLRTAEQKFREAIEIDRENSSAWHNLGTILDDMKRYPEAEQAYREAIAIDPNYAFPRNGLGNVLHDTKRYPEAEQAYREAIAIDPNDADPRNGLGNVLHDTKRYPEAEQAYREAIQLDPNYAFPRNGLGNVLAKTKRYPEAEQAFREAIEINPNDAFPRQGLGNVLRETKRYPEAEQAYREAIQIDPNYATPRNGLGSLLRDTKRYPEAEQAYREAIQLDPSFTFAYYNFSLLAKERGDTRVQSALLRHVVLLDGWHADQDILGTIAKHFLHAGNFPLLTRTILEAHPLLLLAPTWIGLSERMWDEHAGLLACFDALPQATPEAERDDLLLKARMQLLYGDPKGADGTLDVLDMHHEQCTAVHYLLIHHFELLDAGLNQDLQGVVQEALERAEQVEQTLDAEPEQLYYAGLIFDQDGQRERAARCWELNPGHLHSMYNLMLHHHDARDHDKRDACIVAILKIVNTRVAARQPTYLGGRPPLRDVTPETAQWKDYAAFALRHAEVEEAVRILGTILRDDPENPAWNSFSTQPVASLAYGPEHVVDTWELSPRLREQYRKTLMRNPKEIERLRTILHGSCGEWLKQCEETQDAEALEVDVSLRILNGTEEAKIKTLMVSYLFQSERLAPQQAITLFLYQRQLEESPYLKKATHYLSPVFCSLGTGTLAWLLSDSTALVLLGGSAGGAALGPLLEDVLGLPLFSTRHEDYATFRDLLLYAIKITAKVQNQG